MFRTALLEMQFKRKEDNSMKRIVSITILLIVALSGSSLACDPGESYTQLTWANPCDVVQEIPAVKTVKLYGYPSDETVEIAGLENFNPCDINLQHVVFGSVQ